MVVRRMSISNQLPIRTGPPGQVRPQADGNQPKSLCRLEKNISNKAHPFKAPLLTRGPALELETHIVFPSAITHQSFQQGKVVTEA